MTVVQKDLVDIRVPGSLGLSGTHGVEGYAGSFAQIAMLQNPDMFPLPAGWRAVHVHQINPFGASYGVKENEDNADQNKNVGRLWEKNLDNPILVEFIDALNIPALGDPAAQQAAATVPAALAMKYGPERLNNALKLGQGVRPIGIGYFGPSRSWSTQVLDRVTSTYLPSAKQVVYIDWHTAVGEFGSWTVLAVEDSSLSVLNGWMQGSGTPVLISDVPSGDNKPFFEYARGGSGTAAIVRMIVEAGTYKQEDYQAYLALSHRRRAPVRFRATALSHDPPT